MSTILDEVHSATYFSPSLENQQSKFERWGRHVRDPANESCEGFRRLECDGAYAEYDVAPLPDGRWAVRTSVGYDYGNCHSRSTPWTALATRQECLDAFVRHARVHFAKELHPADSCVSERQRRARQKMLQRLTVGLFGFVEPKAEPASTDSP